MATPEDAFRPSGPEVEAAHTEAKSIDLAQDLQKIGEQQVAAGDTVAGEHNLATGQDVLAASEAGRPLSEANVDAARAAIASQTEAQPAVPQAEIDAAHTDAKSEDLSRGLTQLGNEQNANGEGFAGRSNLDTAAFVTEMHEAGTPISEDKLDAARASLARITAESAESAPPAQ